MQGVWLLPHAVQGMWLLPQAVQGVWLLPHAVQGVWLLQRAGVCPHQAVQGLWLLPQATHPPASTQRAGAAGASGTPPCLHPATRRCGLMPAWHRSWRLWQGGSLRSTAEA